MFWADFPAQKENRFFNAVTAESDLFQGFQVMYSAESELKLQFSVDNFESEPISSVCNLELKRGALNHVQQWKILHQIIWVEVKFWHNRNSRPVF